MAAEIPRNPNYVNDKVADFLEKQERQRREEKAQGKALARELIYQMSDGNYGIDVFIFVASLGEPERYREQLEMLQIAEQLPAGRVVGITQGDRLGCVGIVRENPLVLKVNAGLGDYLQGEQYGRELRATLYLTSMVRDSDVGCEAMGMPRVPIHETGDPECPFAACLLWAHGEQKTHPDAAEAFFRPCGLVTGPEAIFEFIEQNHDSGGQRQVAMLMHRMARSQVGELAVSAS